MATTATLEVIPHHNLDDPDKIIEHWNNDGDFLNHTFGTGGRYANRSDIEQYMPECRFVNIRYNRQRDVVVLSPDATGWFRR